MSDISGLDDLIRDLSDAPRKVQRQVPEVVRKGAVNVRDEWRQRASGLRHAPAYPRSITFDDEWQGNGYEARIGPDKTLPQGALGNLIEYGSANNPPQGHGSAAATSEEPRFEKALEHLVDL